LGLVRALESYTRDLGKRVGVKTDFEAAGLDGMRLPAEAEIAMYRVVQEAQHHQQLEAAEQEEGGGHPANGAGATHDKAPRLPLTAGHLLAVPLYRKPTGKSNPRGGRGEGVQKVDDRLAVEIRVGHHDAVVAAWEGDKRRG